jgi:hypothetical protein
VTSGHKKQPPDELVWNMMVELRKEILESQKIRAQIVGVKVTFVTAVYGLIAANLDKKVPLSTLAAPAFAAIFLDFLIASYSFSIKRMGHYVWKNIEEKILRREYDWPPGMLLWEEFMHSLKQHRLLPSGESLSIYGNVGMTAIATVLGGVGIWFGELSLDLRIGLIVPLVIFFVASFYAQLQSSKFDDKQVRS